MRHYFSLLKYLLVFYGYFNISLLLNLFTKGKYFSGVFVNAYLKNITTCIIVENKCIYNQLAFINSYCYEENTFRIYQTNIQHRKLIKRNIFKETNNNDENNGNTINENHNIPFIYRKKNYNNENNKKKIEEKFLRSNNLKINRTELNIKLFKEGKYDEENKNGDDNINESMKNINYSYNEPKISLIGRSTGLKDYSSELCKIDYDNFSKQGVYLFDSSNRLIYDVSVPVKSIYICKEDNAINCYLPINDGFFLNTLQKGEVIELSGAQKLNTVITNIKPEDGYSFINSESLPKETNKYNKDLIICNYNSDEKKVLCNIVDGLEGTFYIQKSSKGNYLIECYEGYCSENRNPKDGFYVNSVSSSNTLIYCKKYNCSLHKFENDKYYIGNQHSESAIIECKNNICSYNNDISSGYYVNTGIQIEDNAKPIIYCDSFHICTSQTINYNKNSHFISASDPGYLITCKNDTFCEQDDSIANIGYYINNVYDEISTEANLIYCYDKNDIPQNRVCEEVNVESTNEKGHFISGEQGNLIHYVIINKKNYAFIQSRPEAGYYLNNGNTNNNTLPIIYCEGAANTTLAISCNPVASKDGYYLMQSSKIDADIDYYTQLIFCEDSICTNFDPVKGYFKYALDSNYIIKCDGIQCYLDEPENCQSSFLPRIYYPGYCCNYKSNTYLIVEAYNITTIVTGVEFMNYSMPFQPDDDIKYAYFNVEYSDFPGMTINQGALYKITKNSFTYYPYNDYFIMTEDNKQLLSVNKTLSTKYDLDKWRIFNCDSSHEICIPEENCDEVKYIYYDPLNLGIECRNTTLEILNKEGNYIDDNDKLIRCDNTGKSKLLTPSIITNSTLNGYDIDVESCYLINSGYDNSTYPLIKCTKTSCSLYEPKKGFYYDCEAKKVIKYKNIEEYYYLNHIKEFPTYYINAGSKLDKEQLISCNSTNCTIVPPNEGYYLSENNNRLIHCDKSNLCKEIRAEKGYYSDPNSLKDDINYIIRCAYNSTNDLNCFKEKANEGFYLSTKLDTLINCVNDDKTCKIISKKVGIYVSAVFNQVSDNNKLPRNLAATHNEKNRNLIMCTVHECKELSELELMAIPICEYSENKCFISSRYSSFRMQTSLITKGGFCTNYHHTVLYFATDSIQTEPKGEDVNYNKLFKNLDENCIIASSRYRFNYFVIDNTIYNIDNYQISTKTDMGYYFIDVLNHELLNSTNIKYYNEDSVQLFHCNGKFCSTKNEMASITYFVDVNRKLFKYDPFHNKYFFLYDQNIICSYNKNLCVVSKNVTSEEFCIGDNGRLVFLQDQITLDSKGDCTMVVSDNLEIMVYYQNLYRLSAYKAVLMEEKGFYLLNNSTKTSAELKDFKDKSQTIILYGCNGSICKEYTPAEGIYYYDRLTKYLFKYENNFWSTVSESGYANISIYPGLAHIFKFETFHNEVTISSNTKIYGNYYTVDQKMFNCDVNNNECLEQNTTGYVLTAPGEIYYCEYNSHTGVQKIYENKDLSSTSNGYRNILSSCIKKKCKIGEYYYMDNHYYQCKTDSIFVLMKKEQCIDYLDVKDIRKNHKDIAETEGFGKYIINFPTKDQDNYPDNIKYLNYLIEINNNSTAEDSSLSLEYLSSISGVFYNCRYDLETSTMVFDLICLNNYVSKAKDLANENKIILEYKDNGIEKGNMHFHGLSGMLSSYRKRETQDSEDENSEDDKIVLESYEISYKQKNQPFICSTKNYGYIECQKDNNNPDKCVPSHAIIKYELSIKCMFVIFILNFMRYLFN